MNRSIYRQFVLYTIPTVAAMLVNGLYQVVDGIFIGHYVGAEGLAGINVAWPVIGTILGIGMLVGVAQGLWLQSNKGKAILTVLSVFWPLD
ncbi:Na+ driven multidrug efflux pump [Vibrio cholerae]|nr:Na+ driven multidrug efflux pump [Vibrio cholerae]